MSIYRRNPELGTILEVMDRIKKPMEKEYNEIRKKHKLGESGVFLELTAIAVHKDYGKRGIGGHLTNLTVENAKKAGYWIAFAECSSAFSTRALEKFGAKTEYSIDYKTFEIPGGCCSKPSYPLQHATEPHTKCNLVVFRLKDEVKEEA